MASFDPTAFLEQSARPGRAVIREPGLLRQIGEFLREFAATAFDPYRPELHYMRGPGPAWYAKQRAEARARKTK